MLWRTPLSFFTSNRSSPSLSVASPATYLLCVRILASVLTVLTRLGPPFFFFFPPFFFLSFLYLQKHSYFAITKDKLSLFHPPPSFPLHDLRL